MKYKLKHIFWKIEFHPNHNGYYQNEMTIKIGKDLGNKEHPVVGRSINW